MTNSVTVPQQINWTVETIFNSIEINYSGYFTIAVGHTYGGPVVTPPTCTEAGFTAHTCKIPTCGYSYTDSPLDALGHDPGEWVVIQPATNKKAGLETLSCLRCGVLLESRKIPLLSETWPDNTACSYGPRFRDVTPELTDRWYNLYACGPHAQRRAGGAADRLKPIPDRHRAGYG